IVNNAYATKHEPLTVTNVVKCRLFALIIGIDVFRDPSFKLCGAVNDANAVEDFLISELGVPKHRIVNLRNNAATRKAILAAMESLAENQEIYPTDPLLIYYAGHGAEALPPDAQWETSSPNGMIQMLLPYDFIRRGSSNERGQGILDIEISHILHHISTKKSDNIVS
ncbi:hypothetical protein H0H87_011250, partial [Tephrocybe sp. NHM501043]